MLRAKHAIALANALRSQDVQGLTPARNCTTRFALLTRSCLHSRRTWAKLDNYCCTSCQSFIYGPRAGLGLLPAAAVLCLSAGLPGLQDCR
jgi:hypothetical protein